MHRAHPQPRHDLSAPSDTSHRSGSESGIIALCPRTTSYAIFLIQAAGTSLCTSDDDMIGMSLCTRAQTLEPTQLQASQCAKR